MWKKNHLGLMHAHAYIPRTHLAPVLIGKKTIGWFVTQHRLRSLKLEVYICSINFGDMPPVARLDHLILQGTWRPDDKSQVRTPIQLQFSDT